MNRLLVALSFLLLVPFVAAGPLGPNNFHCNDDSVVASMGAPGFGEYGKTFIYEDGWVIDENDYSQAYGQAGPYDGAQNFQFGLTGDPTSVQWTSDLPIDKIAYGQLGVDGLVYTTVDEGGNSGKFTTTPDRVGLVSVFACVNKEHYANGWPVDEVPEFGTIAAGAVMALGVAMVFRKQKK